MQNNNKNIKKLNGSFIIQINSLPYNTIEGDRYYSETSKLYETNPELFEIEQEVTDSTTLEDLKLQKNSQINMWRDHAKKNEGANYKDDIFDIDETSQNNLTSLIMMCQLKPDTIVTYRSKTNNNHNFNCQELVELGLAVNNKIQEIYQKSWDLKEQVKIAENKEELGAIVW